MPKKSRAAREQPSPGPSTNAPVTGVGSANACWNPLDVVWAAQMHAGILSTSGVVVLCIVSLGWVSWRGVYLLFLQLQQLLSTCFSTAGNVMTKKRSHLTCDNMEELVYLYEVWPQVRGWEAVKKMRSA